MFRLVWVSLEVEALDVLLSSSSSEVTGLEELLLEEVVLFSSEEGLDVLTLELLDSLEVEGLSEVVWVIDGSSSPPSSGAAKTEPTEPARRTRVRATAAAMPFILLSFVNSYSSPYTALPGRSRRMAGFLIGLAPIQHGLSGLAAADAGFGHLLLLEGDAAGTDAGLVL